VSAVENEVSANRFLVFGLAITLAACAATGPRYSEHVGALADVPPKSTRLTVFRTTESTQYSGRSVTVRIDGRERGGCDFGGFQTFDVSAGPHILAVDMWDAPGRCRLSIEVLGGETYFYEISPRPANFGADFLGGLVGLIGGPLAGWAGSFAAMDAESSGKECGGAFSIVEVDEGVALRKLNDLRRSK
jgi:hypothetical protein